MPDISIIIPIFNSEETIIKAINSIISQKFYNWELILVNDGSEDKSGTVIIPYLEDARISYYYQENCGVSSARNFGASVSNGEWLIFLDSDDFLEADSLSVIYSEISSNSNFDYLQFGLKRLKMTTTIFEVPSAKENFPRLAGTFLIKSFVFKKLGGYDSNLKFSENTELFHRVELEGFIGRSVPKIILNYCDNPTGGSKNLQNMIDSLTIILTKHKDTLSPHIKHLYYQIIGVNLMRFRKFSMARYHLIKAIEYKPTKLATWGRFALACYPYLAKRLYSETVKHA